jgi:hypothetical protein
MFAHSKYKVLETPRIGGAVLAWLLHARTANDLDQMRVSWSAPWNVTSFQAFGIDVIQEGMTMKLTLTAGKTFTMVITTTSSARVSRRPAARKAGHIRRRRHGSRWIPIPKTKSPSTTRSTEPR